MEEGKDAEHFVFAAGVPFAHCTVDLQHVSDDVAVAKHYAFGETGCTGGVGEEGEVFVGILLSSAVATGAGCLADVGPLLVLAILIWFGTKDDDAILWDVSLLGSFDSIG